MPPKQTAIKKEEDDRWTERLVQLQQNHVAGRDVEIENDQDNAALYSDELKAFLIKCGFKHPFEDESLLIEDTKFEFGDHVRADNVISNPWQRKIKFGKPTDAIVIRETAMNVKLIEKSAFESRNYNIDVIEKRKQYVHKQLRED